MKKTFLAILILGFILFTGGLTTVLFAQSTAGGDAAAPAKSSKKTKKSKKKSKKSSTKVSKTAQGEQDEVSDQSDVSSQADKSTTKKKR